MVQLVSHVESLNDPEHRLLGGYIGGESEAVRVRACLHTVEMASGTFEKSPLHGMNPYRFCRMYKKISESTWVLFLLFTAQWDLRLSLM